MRKFACLILLLCLPSVSLALDAPVFYGEEIVVTASRRLQPVSEAFSSVKVIKAEDIEKIGAKTAADALRSIAGIYVKSSGDLGSVSTVRLRSATASQVLVLLDGQTINSPLLGLADLGNIPAYNIERIEIVEDAISSVYGSAALGGVINIITRKAQDRPITASLNYGSYGQIGGYVGLSGKHDDISSYVFYQDLKTDGFRQNSDYRNRGYGINLDFGTAAFVKYNISSSDRGNPGVPTSDSDPWSASYPFDRQKDFSSNLSVGFRQDIGNSINKIVVSDNLQDQHVLWEDYLGVLNENRNFGRIYGGEYQNVSAISNVTLTSGLEFKRSIGEASAGGTGNRSIDDTSVYVGLDSKASLPMSASFVLRADSNSIWGTEINPKVSAAINFGNAGRVRYSFAQAFRAPTINELYWDTRPWMFGNPDLKPEKSNSFNISYEKVLSDCSLSVGYYSNKISNMILWTLMPDYTYVPININSKIEGVEASLEKQIFPDIVAYARYNNESSVNLSTEKKIYYSPAYKLNLGAALTKGPLSLNLNSRDVSSVYTDPENTKTIPPYRVVDLTVLGGFMSSKVSVSILNLFDEKYFETVGNDKAWQERGYPMPGRRFEIKVSY
jgi:outer membrane cobalamin receptor